MKKLSIMAFCMIFMQNFANAQDCTQPTITESSGEGMYCVGDEVTLKIKGELNDADIPSYILQRHSACPLFPS